MPSFLSHQSLSLDLSILVLTTHPPLRSSIKAILPPLSLSPPRPSSTNLCLFLQYQQFSNLSIFHTLPPLLTKPTTPKAPDIHPINHFATILLFRDRSYHRKQCAKSKSTASNATTRALLRNTCCTRASASSPSAKKRKSKTTGAPRFSARRSLSNTKASVTNA